MNERMITPVFGEQHQEVFWIVGSNTGQRHAMTTRPGAVYAGQTIPALCGAEVKIPQPTPSGRAPRSTNITARCAECAQRSDDTATTHTTWDF